MDSTATASSTTSHPTDQGRKGRGLILFGAIGVALISTGAAYVAMVGFGRDVLEMTQWNALAFAGVFELSLVTVALMAREAAQQLRPAPVLLGLTWMLSAASGFFAGWHEIHLDHGAVAAAFRFIVPLLAALMWHLALIGDRHLATGTTWRDMLAERIEKRRHARMEISMDATEKWFRTLAAASSDPSAKNRRAVERANQARIQAQRDVRQVMKPAEVADQITAWTDLVRAQALGTRTVGEVVTAEIRHTTGVQIDLDQITNNESTIVELTARHAAESLETVSRTAPVDDRDKSDGVSKPVSASPETVSGDTVDSVSESPETPQDAVSKDVSPSLETVSSSVHQGVSESQETVSPSVRDGVSGVSTGVSKPVETPGETVSKPVSKSTERPAKKSPSKKSRGKIDASLDAEIFARDAAGEPAQVIADALGIGRSTVYKRLQANTEAHTPAYGIPAVQVD